MNDPSAPRPTSSPSPRPPRGSVLLLVMMIVAVVAVIGMAALALTQRESANVTQRVRSDMLLSCARAASSKLRAEFALYGATGGVFVAPTEIPGTDLRLALDHFDTDEQLTASPPTFTTVELSNSMKPMSAAAASRGMTDMDDTNRVTKGSLGGTPHLMIAHCTDGQNNQYEVELFVKLGL